MLERVETSQLAASPTSSDTCCRALQLRFDFSSNGRRRRCYSPCLSHPKTNIFQSLLQVYNIIVTNRHCTVHIYMVCRVFTINHHHGPWSVCPAVSLVSDKLSLIDAADHFLLSKANTMKNWRYDLFNISHHSLLYHFLLCV